MPNSQYLDAVKKAEEWANLLRHKIAAHSPAKTAAEARALLEHHGERKAEMDAREVRGNGNLEGGNKAT